MTKLDQSNLNFWESLGILGECDYRLNFPTCSFQGTLDLSSIQRFENSLAVLSSGWNLHHFTHSAVYATVEGLALHIITKNRGMEMILQPKCEECRRQLTFIAGTFSLRQMPPDFESEGPLPPPLCPCCQEAAHERIRRIAENPLTIVLALSASKHIPLIISSQSHDGNMSTKHSPTTLIKEGEQLLSQGVQNHIAVNIRHLHAFHLGQDTIDGESYRTLSILNSHGNPTCQISAPSCEVDSLWTTIFNRRDHPYHIIGTN